MGDTYGLPVMDPFRVPEWGWSSDRIDGQRMFGGGFSRHSRAVRRDKNEFADGANQ